MAKKATNTIAPEKMERYQKLVNSVPGLELKGASMPYTSCNGHMFSFLDKEGQLGLRLPEEKREEFIKKFKTILCEAHGTVLKEYVSVPEKAWGDKGLKQYFKFGFEYVKALKPKATKR